MKIIRGNEMNYGNVSELIHNPQGAVCTAEQETIRQRLERQLKIHVERAESIKQAIKFMDDNPNFESFHNLIGKIGF